MMISKLIIFTEKFPLLKTSTGAINVTQPCRTKLVGYPGRMMLRDIKRRTLIRKYWPERYRYQTLRKNMIFPDSFKVFFSKIVTSLFTLNNPN